MRWYKAIITVPIMVIGFGQVSFAAKSPRPESSGESARDPWSGTAQELADYVSAHSQRLNYGKILGEAQVLFLGERLGNEAVGEHIVESAPALKESGITHYLIEANEKGNHELARLSRGQPVDLSHVDIGYGGKEREPAIREMARNGIAVVAFDIDQSTDPSREAREARMKDNLLKILRPNPQAKVAVLVSASHIDRRQARDGVDMLARRIKNEGIPAISVRLAGGTDGMPTQLTEAVRRAGLSHKTFSLDLRPHAESKNVIYGGGAADHIVHLPQRTGGLMRGNSQSLQSAGTILREMMHRYARSDGPRRGSSREGGL